MKYKTFGRKTGLRVSQIAFGTGNFGTGWGYGSTIEEARKVFDRYIEAGGNFIDTADSYQEGQSETMVGQLIEDQRDQIVLSSKFTLGTNSLGGISGTGNSRKTIMKAVEGSLKRLKTDRIDLYWAHFSDQLTPMEEILRAFDDLVSSGKTLYAGLSNFPAWRISRAEAIAELRGWAPLAGIQIEYSLVERTPDRELLPMAEALGLGAALWSPLGGGFLSGKYRTSDEGRKIGFGGRLVHTEKSQFETNILDTVLAIAKELEVQPVEVALSWILNKANHSATALIPILGSKTVEQFDSTIGALKINLSDDQFERLNTASAISLGSPHTVIGQTLPRVLGGKPDSIISPRIPVP